MMQPQRPDLTHGSGVEQPYSKAPLLSLFETGYWARCTFGLTQYVTAYVLMTGPTFVNSYYTSRVHLLIHIRMQMQAYLHRTLDSILPCPGAPKGCAEVVLYQLFTPPHSCQHRNSSTCTLHPAAPSILHTLPLHNLEELQGYFELQCVAIALEGLFPFPQPTLTPLPTLSIDTLSGDWAGG